MMRELGWGGGGGGGRLKSERIREEGRGCEGNGERGGFVGG